MRDPVVAGTRKTAVVIGNGPVGRRFCEKLVEFDGGGNYEAPAAEAVPLIVEDPFARVYKKLLSSPDGQKLVGGILVGDASDYPMLSVLAKTGENLMAGPSQLAGVGSAGTQDGSVSMSDEAQICSCNNVSLILQKAHSLASWGPPLLLAAPDARLVV